MKKIRESNFELMRIISMFLIIIWHILIHGNVINNCANPGVKVFLEISMFFILIHVNSFVILTGYFQSASSFKKEKLIKLVVQVITYSSIITLIGLNMGWDGDFRRITIFNSFLPSVLGNYWFIVAYLIVYIFSDYINKFIHSLSKPEYKKLLFIGFLIFSVIPFVSGMKLLYNDGYNFYSFIYLYMVGGYLRMYPLKESYHFKQMSIKKYRYIIIFLFVICGLLNYFINDFAYKIVGFNEFYAEVANRIFGTHLVYSTPFAIIQSICFFELFKTIKIRNRLINYISSTVFGIYLLHDNIIIKNNVYRMLGLKKSVFVSFKTVPYVIFIALIIFISCCLIELIRKKIENIVICFIKKIKPRRVI